MPEKLRLKNVPKPFWRQCHQCESPAPFPCFQIFLLQDVLSRTSLHLHSCGASVVCKRGVNPIKHSQMITRYGGVIKARIELANAGRSLVWQMDPEGQEVRAMTRISARTGDVQGERVGLQPATQRETTAISPPSSLPFSFLYTDRNATPPIPPTAAHHTALRSHLTHKPPHWHVPSADSASAVHPQLKAAFCVCIYVFTGVAVTAGGWGGGQTRHRADSQLTHNEDKERKQTKTSLPALFKTWHPIRRWQISEIRSSPVVILLLVLQVFNGAHAAFFVKDTHRLCILKGTKWPLLSSWAAPGKYMSGMMSRGNTDTWWQRRVLFHVGGRLQHTGSDVDAGYVGCVHLHVRMCMCGFCFVFSLPSGAALLPAPPGLHSWSFFPLVLLSFFHQRPLQSPLLCHGACRCCWARFCCLLAQFWAPSPPCSPNQCVNRANLWHTADSWCHDCDLTCSSDRVDTTDPVTSHYNIRIILKCYFKAK